MIKHRVSIIIRAKNEGKMLPACLRKVYSQDYRDFEIIFVDSGSTDDTIDIVKRFQNTYKNIKIIEISPEEFTYGYALNIGCAYAMGEYLIALSAHAIPKSDRWLYTLIKYFEDERVAGVGNWSNKVFVQTLATFLKNPYFGFDNANSAFRKNLWEEYKFREDMIFTEDKDWEFYFLKKGFITIYDPDVAVKHEHCENLRDIYIRSYKAHHGFAQFLDTTATNRMLKMRLIILGKKRQLREFFIIAGAYNGLRSGYKDAIQRR